MSVKSLLVFTCIYLNAHDLIMHITTDEDIHTLTFADTK